MGELENQPGERHRLHPGAGETDRLAGEVQPVVAYPQSRERARRRFVLPDGSSTHRRRVATARLRAIGNRAPSKVGELRNAGLAGARARWAEQVRLQVDEGFEIVHVGHAIGETDRLVAQRAAHPLDGGLVSASQALDVGVSAHDLGGQPVAERSGQVGGGRLIGAAPVEWVHAVDDHACAVHAGPVKLRPEEDGLIQRRGLG